MTVCGYTRRMESETPIEALLFDVFGTVVDWRGSVIREAAAFGRANGIDADWEAFADAWRGKYGPYMDKVRTGALPWTNLDGLHRLALEELLDEFGIRGVSEAAKAELNLAWHRLEPWPDAPAGLARLKARFIIAAMSNGNVALMTNLARYAGLPWDCILGAELARAYKPDPQDLPDRRGVAWPGAGRSDDGGRPCRRPAGGGGLGPEDRVRAAPPGTRPGGSARPGCDRSVRRGRRRFPRPRRQAWRLIPRRRRTARPVP